MVNPAVDLVAPERPVPDPYKFSVLAERERIANYLHDNMAQDLAFVHSQAAVIRLLLAKDEINQAMEQIKLLENVSQNLSGDLRKMISQLNNVDKASPPLDIALKLLIERFSQRHQIPIHYNVQSSDLIANLSPQVSVELYNIVQEALTNVYKHAAANAVWVKLSENETCFDVIIRDDGCGILAKMHESHPADQHFGLSIMQARAHKIGADLKIEELENSGTQITICIPHRFEGKI